MILYLLTKLLLFAPFVSHSVNSLFCINFIEKTLETATYCQLLALSNKNLHILLVQKFWIYITNLRNCGKQNIFYHNVSTHLIIPIIKILYISRFHLVHVLRASDELFCRLSENTQTMLRFTRFDFYKLNFHRVISKKRIYRA